MTLFRRISALALTLVLVLAMTAGIVQAKPRKSVTGQSSSEGTVNETAAETTQLTGADTLHDLDPRYHPEATGELNVLLVPVVWMDALYLATDDTLNSIKSEFGRFQGANGGSGVDYSEYMSSNIRFSLSEYFDIASYGKLTIHTTAVEWIYHPLGFDDWKTKQPTETDYIETVTDCLVRQYPDRDWSNFDRDGNGYFDAVVIVNVSSTVPEEFDARSFGGGAYFELSEGEIYRDEEGIPLINNFISINYNRMNSNLLIHEFGHLLGLTDYHDATAVKADPVGGFDMQSGMMGDWNPYSKYAAGWIEPTVVDLEPGETAEFTIGASCDTGDTLLIPVNKRTFDGPFNEYILVDLFTAGGVNVHDAIEFGLGGLFTDADDLENLYGVRIYHVDARMARQTRKVDAHTIEEIGVPMSTNAYSAEGNYHLELIQAGRVNTFTNQENLRTSLEMEDLFRAGMTFSVDADSEFFHEGKMNDGSDFNYTIEVVTVSAEEAVIRVTATE